jgi:hypothetical protein
MLYFCLIIYASGSLRVLLNCGDGNKTNKTKCTGELRRRLNHRKHRSFDSAPVDPENATC